MAISSIENITYAHRFILKTHFYGEIIVRFPVINHDGLNNSSNVTLYSSSSFCLICTYFLFDDSFFSSCRGKVPVC